jgi:hypothetical protein
VVVGEGEMEGGRGVTRVLLVDDSPVDRRVVQLLLSSSACAGSFHGQSSQLISSPPRFFISSSRQCKLGCCLLVHLSVSPFVFWTSLSLSLSLLLLLPWLPTAIPGSFFPPFSFVMLILHCFSFHHKLMLFLTPDEYA